MSFALLFFVQGLEDELELAWLSFSLLSQFFSGLLCRLVLPEAELLDPEASFPEQSSPGNESGGHSEGPLGGHHQVALSGEEERVVRELIQEMSEEGSPKSPSSTHVVKVSLSILTVPVLWPLPSQPTSNVVCRQFR